MLSQKIDELMHPPGKEGIALSYIPVLLNQLNADGKEMFAEVLQAMRDGGYRNGFRDGCTNREDQP